MEDQHLEVMKNKRSPLDIAGAMLSVLGATFMGYLISLHFSGGDSSLCDLSESLNCSVVNTSIYSDIFGIPVSVLGLVYFLSMLVLFLSSRFAKKYAVIVGFSVFSLVFGLYLSGIEYFVLGSFCLFCELSKVLMVLLLGVAAGAVKKSAEHVSLGVIIAGFVVGLLFAAGAFSVQRAPVGIPDYTAHAQCLTAKGVHMYGAYWCPKCAKQKKAFGAAFDYVSYVECDPRGEDPQPQRCIDAGLKGTPTWVQETDDGEIIDMWQGWHEVADVLERYECLDPSATEETNEDVADDESSAPDVEVPAPGEEETS